MNKVIVKEGLYSPKFHTHMHITSNGDIIDCLPKSYKHILKIEQENTNLKQTLNEIREYCNENIQMCKDEQSTDEWECCIEEPQGVLQIINRVLGDEK